ncbi:MAG: flagellar biosynthesis protein FlhF [Woeseiaceae bacterium]|nr:flagellar biosynthesis protein FlhF [Woeseiaceae bacterium]
MKIKRYLDTDMRHVLRRVREDQGPDAVILSNRRVPEGIEVIAAIDYDEALIRHALGLEGEAGAELSSDALAEIAEDDAPPRPAPAAAATPEVVSADLRSQALDAGSLRMMQEEIGSLRRILESQVAGLVWNDLKERAPLRAQVLKNLAQLGVAPDVANIVLDRLGPLDEVRSIWQAPLAELGQLIPVRNDDLLEAGGVFALIGPTGVGKTTTIAKIAAHYALENSPDEIALVSADAFRIGAREHLTAFANIIGANVYAAGNSAELGELLIRLRNKRLVLIDTEGRSPRDRQLTNRLAAWGRNRDRVRFLLTLSAATQETALEEAVREFSRVPIEGCILTKIDEAGQLGCAISTLVRHDLRAAWFADGQRIPEDLHAAKARRLWLVNQAVECLEHSRPEVDERQVAERYVQPGVVNA